MTTDHTSFHQKRSDPFAKIMNELYYYFHGIFFLKRFRKPRNGLRFLRLWAVLDHSFPSLLSPISSISFDFFLFSKFFLNQWNFFKPTVYNLMRLNVIQADLETLDAKNAPDMTLRIKDKPRLNWNLLLIPLFILRSFSHLIDSRRQFCSSFRNFTSFKSFLKRSQEDWIGLFKPLSIVGRRMLQSKRLYLWWISNTTL